MELTKTIGRSARKLGNAAAPVELGDVLMVAGHRNKPFGATDGSGAAEQHGKVAEVGEGAHRQADPAPGLDRLHPGLEVDGHGLVRRAGS